MAVGFNVIGGVIREAGGIIDDVWTSDEERLQAQYLEKKLEAAPHLGQIKINKTEAGHASWFVAGWRPAVGWVIALGLSYAIIFEPILGWFFAYFAPDMAAPPKVDGAQLLSLLGMMLGLAGARSWEKVHGAAREAIRTPLTARPQGASQLPSEQPGAPAYPARPVSSGPRQLYQRGR